MSFLYNTNIFNKLVWCIFVDFMASLIFARAKKDDFESIFVLLGELWPRENLNKVAIKKIFLNNIDEKKKGFFVVKVKGKLIGFASLDIRYNFQHGKVGLIDEIVVKEGFRGKGIGKRFLNFVLKQAKRQGCKFVELFSAMHRRRAHKFYLNNGFVKASYHFIKRV